MSLDDELLDQLLEVIPEEDEGDVRTTFESEIAIREEIIPWLRQALLTEAGEVVGGESRADLAEDAIFGDDLPSKESVIEKFGMVSDDVVEYLSALEAFEAERSEDFGHLDFVNKPITKAQLRRLSEYIRLFLNIEAWEDFWSQPKHKIPTARTPATKRLPVRPLDVSRFDQIRAVCKRGNKVRFEQLHSNGSWYSVPLADEPKIVLSGDLAIQVKKCTEGTLTTAEEVSPKGPAPWVGLPSSFWMELEPDWYAIIFLKVLNTQEVRNRMKRFMTQDSSLEVMDTYLYRMYMSTLKKEYCLKFDCPAKAVSLKEEAKMSKADAKKAKEAERDARAVAKEIEREERKAAKEAEREERKAEKAEERRHKVATKYYKDVMTEDARQEERDARALAKEIEREERRNVKDAERAERKAEKDEERRHKVATKYYKDIMTKAEREKEKEAEKLDKLIAKENRALEKEKARLERLAEKDEARRHKIATKYYKDIMTKAAEEEEEDEEESDEETLGEMAKRLAGEAKKDSGKLEAALKKVGFKAAKEKRAAAAGPKGGMTYMACVKKVKAQNADLKGKELYAKASELYGTKACPKKKSSSKKKSTSKGKKKPSKAKKSTGKKKPSKAKKSSGKKKPSKAKKSTSKGKKKPSKAKKSTSKGKKKPSKKPSSKGKNSKKRTSSKGRKKASKKRASKGKR